MIKLTLVKVLLYSSSSRHYLLYLLNKYHVRQREEEEMEMDAILNLQIEIY